MIRQWCCKTGEKLWNRSRNHPRVVQDIAGIRCAAIASGHPLWKSSFGDMPLKPVTLSQQKRWMGGRHGGASAVARVRPPTRKQRKRYNRAKGKLYQEKVGKHSPPNSKASQRREEIKEDHKLLFERYFGDNTTKYLPDNVEYDGSDAMVDDLLGNTAHLTSEETPTPERVGFRYPSQRAKIRHLLSQNKDPEDEEIALMIRAYRDTKTKRRRPIGISKALTHIVEKLGVPLSLFGEYSFHSLMSCSASPKEALRVMDLMSTHSIPHNAYTFSILCDIYANAGDYRACNSVLMDQMPSHNLHPTLAAYTSLLKACKKVVNRGAAPLPLKAEAADIAWEAWKHMRIYGVEADPMAYGAIISLFGARGYAEKCLDLLEEMEYFGVKPTTFVYTAALRGVARSHANALRFSDGKAIKGKRREIIIQHHAEIARQIVIMAEDKEVKQDTGFIAALIMCAGTAGDSATAKAIYLAHLVRENCKHLRPIGDDEHLRRLAGWKQIQAMHNQLSSDEATDNQLQSTDVPQLTAEDQQQLLDLQIQNEQMVREYHEQQDIREHGKDTRLLTALLFSYSSAMEYKGLGNVWSSNGGMLDPKTLEDIVKFQEPRYEDEPKKVTEFKWQDEEDDKIEGRLKMKKFRGMDTIHHEVDDDEEDMDDTEDMIELDDSAIDKEKDQIQEPTDVIQASSPDSDTEIEERIQTLQQEFFKGSKINWDELQEIENMEDVEENTITESEWVTDEDFDMGGDKDTNVDFEGNLSAEELAGLEADLDSDAFSDTKEAHKDHLDTQSSEITSNNEDLTAKLLAEFDDADTMYLDEDYTEDHDYHKQETPSPRYSNSLDDNGVDDRMLQMQTSSPEYSTKTTTKVLDYPTNENNMITHPDNENQLVTDTATDEEVIDAEEQTLQVLLPGLPLPRIRKIRRIFLGNMSDPPLLELIPALRENMPEYLTKSFLKRHNMRSAMTLMKKAEEDGMMDIHVLNGLLQVEASAGRVEDALEVHDHWFQKYGVTPTTYSDRLILTMLLNQRQFSRALAFKSKIERSGRHLDLSSYGALIKYCSDRSHFGSGLLLLRECVDRHGFAPGERCVSKLRKMGRRLGVEEEVGLVELIGEDPNEWWREGEAKRKREKSKVGRRGVVEMRNKFTQI